MYHKGPGVKKSGPKGPWKVAGDVLDALNEELDGGPSSPSHVVAKRVREKTGVDVSARRIREIRQERGKRRSSMRSREEPSPPPNPHTAS
jgi:hypothetical protein